MVTLKVLKKFQDKDNKEKIYQVGETLSTSDLDRVNNLVSRGICSNSGKLLFVPYTKDFGRITQFWGNDLATVLYATFCSDMLSSHSFSKQR